jgi:16S rRNA (adenine1518-N6/adenine1519-N6)-dimethyltransferase
MSRPPARKRWGQHFLIDRNVARRIVDAADLDGRQTVVEVGPGEGALTEPLAERAARLLAIEIDPVRARALSEKLPQESVRILVADALAHPIGGWLDQVGWPPPAVVVANLPYNVATPLLSGWVAEEGTVARMIVMVQREVADRLAARPGDSAYGYLSVRIGLLARSERLFDVPPGAFRPRPQVVSGVVRLVPRPASADRRLIAQALEIASRGFAQRRKTFPNALAGLAERADWEYQLGRLGRDGRVRAEELGPADFIALARGLTPDRGRQR